MLLISTNIDSYTSFVLDKALYRVLYSAPAQPWATAAAAVGPGGGNRLVWGHLSLIKNYTKPRHIIHSPNRLYKDMKYYTKPRILDNSLKLFYKSSNKY